MSSVKVFFFLKWEAKPSAKDGRGGQFFSMIRKILGKIL